MRGWVTDETPDMYVCMPPFSFTLSPEQPPDEPHEEVHEGVSVNIGVGGPRVFHVKVHVTWWVGGWA